MDSGQSDNYPNYCPHGNQHRNTNTDGHTRARCVDCNSVENGFIDTDADRDSEQNPHNVAEPDNDHIR
jgi:hypothetical protein